MTKWTIEELKQLRDIVTKNGGPNAAAFKKAAAKLKKSASSCYRKYDRTDWDMIIAHEYGNANEGGERKPWTRSEDFQLYELLHQLRDGNRYDFQRVGKIMGRSPISCERRFQRNNWNNIMKGEKPLREEIIKAKAQEAQEAQEAAKDASVDHQIKLINRVVDWLVSTVRADADVLKAMSQSTFDSKIAKVFANPDSKFSREEVIADFETIRQLAMDQIESIGMTYPKTRILGKGRYVVVGDSHGKNTSLGMFKLLIQINKTLHPDFIIHIGNISDDDDEISYEWQKIPNLIVLGCLSELHLLKKQIYQYDVVRQDVMLGKLVVKNQYDTGDFSKKNVSGIDPLTLPSLAIVNTHRHEMHSHCSYKEDRIVLSPGCLCVRHQIRTIKQLIFKAGYPHIRCTHAHGFRKYNKQEQDSARWEQGLIIVDVDEKGNAYPSPCRIKQTSLGNTTGYFGMILGEEEVVKAEKRIFFNGDMHCMYHDPKILDIQEQFCMDYKPHAHVNVGDVLDNRALNHHMGGTNGPALFVNDQERVEFKETTNEIAAARFVMDRMRKWAPESFLIIGNHERFATDFAKQMPQLQDLFSIRTMLDTDRMVISVTDLKHTLDLGYMKFIHGDIKIWGGTGGSKLDRVAVNYKENTVIGNIHYPAIRSGCYSVPMTGMLNQQYNEVDASQWMQGFGYADIFEGQCFITLVTVMDGRCIINGKIYSPRDCSSWTIPPHRLFIDIEFKTPSTTCSQSDTKAPADHQDQLNRVSGTSVVGKRIKAS